MGIAFSAIRGTAKAVTYPVRRPRNFFGIVVPAGLIASGIVFGPLETLNGLAVAGKAVGSAFTAAKGLITAGYNGLTCPGVVTEASRAAVTGGVSQSLASEIGRCAAYFPAGVK